MDVITVVEVETETSDQENHEEEMIAVVAEDTAAEAVEEAATITIAVEAMITIVEIDTVVDEVIIIEATAMIAETAEIEDIAAVEVINITPATMTIKAKKKCQNVQLVHVLLTTISIVSKPFT